MEPLASKIRPTVLSEYIGQKHLVGENKPLRMAIELKNLFSFILWGPPGVGKTTLAKIYANAMDANYHELSAVSAKKDEIRNILSLHKNSGKPTILLLDEIHRFNKAQQDFLLPYVETGKLILIGATTENPSFEVIPALLSRCRVFILKELDDSDMEKIIERSKADIGDEAKAWLIQMANGDARQAITMIENTINIYKKITVEALKESLQNKYLRYDKKGEEHYNTISAYIKSMRASNANAALYYLARMIDSGEDPKFIARRMVIFASEDIGIAQPSALIYANEVFRAVETIGLPECQINLAHGTVLMAKAPKNRQACDGFFEAMNDVKTLGNLPIPMELRNAPTKFMKEIGYAKGYEKYTDNDLLPEKLKGKIYI